MKIGFNAKYGYNEIEIPITEKTVPTFDKDGLTDKFSKKVTIYNDTPEDGVNPRRFDRFVIGLCNIQKGMLQSADGTIEKVVNAQTVITKDIEHYKSPIEYLKLSVDIKEQYYTAKVNDFVVLAEVNDVVTNSTEWRDLQNKYKNNGFSVTSVNEYINNMATDNVEIIHA